ncbi:hypothetical protein [Halomarina litorea]|uniref:hypothetical protein n=1 Tax=Halomarina litorea TaxID=2961595 RepID=UPI0020C2FA74|nr:hypothetical protein [Halomarina sp. BCD28]
MSEDPTDVLAAVDRTTTDLHDVIDDLWSDGVITDGDAAEFSNRAAIIGAELRTCVEFAEDGPLSEGGDER